MLYFIYKRKDLIIMKKFKSFLALLLLGGLVATGCGGKDKTPSNSGGSQQNSDGSQSGDSGSGGGNQGGEGGGQQGGEGGGQQGGEGGGQQGGGGQGGGDTTGWNETQTQLMRDYLYGVVLPYPEVEDVQLIYNNFAECIQINSYFEGNQLATYAAKFTTADGWAGGDVSLDVGHPTGTTFAFEKAVTDHGEERYVGVEFYCEDYEDNNPFYSTSGSFYLYAKDPYYYAYDAMLTDLYNALGSASITTDAAIPQLGGVSRYLLIENENDAPYLYVYGYFGENPENYMREALEHEHWTVLDEKTVDNFTQAICPNAQAQIEYHYNQFEGRFMIRFRALSGWNSNLVNGFFTNYLQTVMPIPALQIEGANYTYSEPNTNGTYVSLGRYDVVQYNVRIRKAGLTSQELVNYEPALRNAGYVVAEYIDGSNDFITGSKMVADDKEYSFAVNFNSDVDASHRNEIEFQIYAGPRDVGGDEDTRLASWPADAIATDLAGATDSVPAFAGLHNGFIKQAGYVMVYIDTGIEAQTIADYKALLGTNHFIATGVGNWYRSSDGAGDVKVTVYSNGGGTISIRYEKVVTPVDAVWSSTAVSNAIEQKLLNGNTITDDIPAMNMAGSTEFEVDTTNFVGNEFAIFIGFSNNSCVATYEEILRTGNFRYNVIYPFDNSLSRVGAWISENSQITLYVDYGGGYLCIYVKEYSDFSLPNAFIYYNAGSGWAYDALQDDGNADGQFYLENYPLTQGTEFALCVNNNTGDWRHYDNINTGWSINEDKFGPGDIDEANIKVLETGNYNIFVRKVDNEDHKTITLNVYIAPYAQLNIDYGGGSISHPDLSLKDGSQTEYFIKSVLLYANDQFEAEINGVKYGYDDLKTSGVDDLFEEGNNGMARSLESHYFDIYVETGEPDGEGNRIYVTTAYYAVKHASTGDWSKTDIEPTSEGSTEYCDDDLVLGKGDVFYFRVGDNYYKYNELKTATPVKAWFGEDAEGNLKSLVTGVFTVYCDTNYDNGNIYIEGELKSAQYYMEYLENGESTPIESPLQLEADVYDEFFIQDIEMQSGDKIRFFVSDGYATLKSGGSSANFDTAADYYYECKSAGHYDIYVKIIGDNQGIWIADHVEEVDVTYTLTCTSSWDIADGDALFYAWVWTAAEKLENKGHWIELDAPVSKVFTVDISNFAVGMKIVRVNPDGANKPDTSTTTYGSHTKGDGTIWNESPDIELPGSTASLNFHLDV